MRSPLPVSLLLAATLSLTSAANRNSEQAENRCETDARCTPAAVVLDQTRFHACDSSALMPRRCLVQIYASSTLQGPAKNSCCVV
jgi:hypothetical protein